MGYWRNSRICSSWIFICDLYKPQISEKSDRHTRQYSKRELMGIWDIWIFFCDDETCSSFVDSSSNSSAGIDGIFFSVTIIRSANYFERLNSNLSFCRNGLESIHSFSLNNLTW